MRAETHAGACGSVTVPTHLSELTVSSNWSDAGETFVMIAVLQCPPSESLSSRVSLESRYGTCAVVPRFAPSASALIQLASASSERLMLAPTV